MFFVLFLLLNFRYNEYLLFYILKMAFVQNYRYNIIEMKNISQLQQQISELCQLILIFQSNILSERQKLFNQFSITPNHIWFSSFGTQITKISSKQLYVFMHKNGSTSSKKDCELICRRYSTYRDQKLTKQDLWHIFKPKSLERVDQILQVRISKNVMPKLIHLNFKAQQLIIKILQKTIQYQTYAQQMKNNLSKYKEQFNSFLLKKIDAKYLQCYLIEYLPQIRIKDCEIILKHIIGINKNHQKCFYSFFLKQMINQPKVNPIKTLKLEEEVQNRKNNLQDFSLSKKIWTYGQKYSNHSKPLYLL